MKTPDINILEKESHNSYKIENLLGVDVVLNLDYQEAEDREAILAVLRGEPGIKGSENVLSFDSKLLKIKKLQDQNGDQRFFVKLKKFTEGQQNIDFALGRTNKDSLSLRAVADFDHRSRYALSGILNEIILSKKIKRLVSSSAFQELARKYGFIDMTFTEPILAIINRNSHIKYLVYRNIKKINACKNDAFSLFPMVQDLRQMFLKNGIAPHDLKYEQLMITQQDDQRRLVLIDVEAFTEEKPIPEDSPRETPR